MNIVDQSNVEGVGVCGGVGWRREGVGVCVEG